MPTIEIREYTATKGSVFTDKDALAIGPELERLAKEGRSQALDILQEAESQKSPLHPYFEWNNEIAAEAHRIQQARYMARSIRIKIIVQDKEYNVRAFHPITTNVIEKTLEGTKPYIHISTIMDNPGAAAQVLQEARRQLLAWRNNYRVYENIFSPQFKKVAKAIDALEEEVLGKDALG